MKILTYFFIKIPSLSFIIHINFIKLKFSKLYTLVNYNNNEFLLFKKYINCHKLIFIPICLILVI
jgi:hypothetical protein